METEESALATGTDIARAVLLIRSRLGLGRRHFSARLDCSYFTVRIWETGQNEPNAVYLLKLLAMADNSEERDPLIKAITYLPNHAKTGMLVSA
jgi:DNA-binding transcriptional regulator YiaG